MISEIEREAHQSRRMVELARKLAEECPNTWRWGDGDGGAIINAVFRAFEEAGLREEPQPYNDTRCTCSTHPMEEDDAGQTLYCFYNRGGELLYVGVAENPFARWSRHAKDKPWFGEVSRFETEWFPDRDSVIAAERRAIKVESPKYNIIHNRLEVR